MVPSQLHIRLLFHQGELFLSLHIANLFLNVFVLKDHLDRRQNMLNFVVVAKTFSLVLKQISKLRFCHIAYFGNLNSQLLAVHKEGFLLHVIWG